MHHHLLRVLAILLAAEQRKEWLAYLDSVGACDARDKDRPCKMGPR